MKILVYGLNFWPELTGVGKYSGEMCAWMSRHGHEVSVITTPPYYPAWRVADGFKSSRYQSGPWLDNPGVQITRCPLWVPAKVTTVRRLLHLASFAISSLPILFQALRRKPDVCIVALPTLICAPTLIALAKLFKVPVWAHVQDFEVDAMFSLGMGGSPGNLQAAVLLVESILLKSFGCVSSITPRMVERLLTKGVKPDQAIEFPNWVDLSAIYPLRGVNHFRTELRLDENAIVALYAGNMGEKQGLDILIDAAAALATEPEIRFVLAGDGSARERLERLSSKLSNVTWLPLQPVERLNELLNSADIHLLPQRADAADLVMPSKLTGMLASGRATLGTAMSGTQLGDVLDQVGKRVEPGDLAGLVGALRLLAKDHGLRTHLGSVGRKYAEDKLGIDANMVQFENNLIKFVESTVR